MQIEYIKTTENIGRQNAHTPAHECTIGFDNGYLLSTAGNRLRVDRIASAFERFSDLGAPIAALLHFGGSEIVLVSKGGRLVSSGTQSVGQPIKSKNSRKN